MARSVPKFAEPGIDTLILFEFMSMLTDPVGVRQSLNVILFELILVLKALAMAFVNLMLFELNANLKLRYVTLVIASLFDFISVATLIRPLVILCGSLTAIE